LFTSSNSSPWDIVSNKHTNSMLNLDWCSSNQSSISADGSNSSMYNVIDFISF
jgi:hypothetical protein